MHEHENVFWVAILVGILISCLLAATVQAQPTTISVDLAKAKLVWTWNQGPGGPVEKWQIRCGPTSTHYEILVELPVPAARSIPISQVAPTVGTYFCIVSAQNSFGAGGPSPEVSFQAGQVPSAVQTLTIEAQ